MSLSNVYTVGLNNVGSYQVSGMPFASGSIAVNSTAKKIEFPYVTQWIQVIPHTGSADDVKVGFSENGLGGSNYFRLHVTNNQNHQTSYMEPMPLKVTELWLSCDGSDTASVDVVAGLTNIPIERVANASVSGSNWSGSVGVG
jgi:hypothetical protein